MYPMFFFAYGEGVRGTPLIWACIYMPNACYSSANLRSRFACVGGSSIVSADAVLLLWSGYAPGIHFGAK